MIRARSRVTAYAFWDLSTFMINGSLFVLLGMQVPRSLRSITSHSPVASFGIAVLVALVVVVTRLAWVHLSVSALQRVDRRESRRSRHFDARMRTAAGWAGFRGAVSLAAALAVPVATHDGTPVRERDLIIFVTVVVIVLIMVVQGTTLPAVVGWAGLTGDRERADEMRVARIRATEAVLEALPGTAAELGVAPDTVERLRAGYQDHLDDVRNPRDEATDRERELARRLQLEMLDRKRQAVTRLRNTNQIDEAVLRELQAATDIEELRLLGPELED